MRTMLLLAGPRNEMRPANGSEVSDRPYEQFNPLPLCEEYVTDVAGVMVPGKLPPLGDGILACFSTAQELNEELAEKLTSALKSALTQADDNPSLSPVWSAVTFITPDTLAEWIATNKGKWVAQIWIG